MDITLCKGKKCGLKHTCRRFTDLKYADENYQSYFSEPPYEVVISNENTTSGLPLIETVCDYYIESKQ